MTWLIQPIVRFLIRHMARQVSRRDAKLERKSSAGPGRVGDYCWHAKVRRNRLNWVYLRVSRDVSYLASRNVYKGGPPTVGTLVFHLSRHATIPMPARCCR